ncbi:hypothetical protein [Poseidonibacter lekithochrous]|uniref:hypothetical protein n=1 Tax=Poseidonibacter lekithochrous TaxID=1904463 RepID=UPI000D375159|nr:hypothetical protein [Poseidonibacter lekithochrous]
MVRQKIVGILVEQMEKISASNGFYSEAGTNVSEWREKPLQKDDYPAIIVRDVSSSAYDDSSLKHSLKVEIDVAVSAGDKTTWNMREVSSDVLKAFGYAEEELCFQCEYKGSDSLLEHKDTTYGGVRLEFEVKYNTPRWQQ